MEVKDEDPPWTERERVFIDKMEQNLKKIESILMEVSELEHYLLGPEDADICTESLAERARNECGCEQSYCPTLKEEVEALRWLMLYGISMEQIIFGLHTIVLRSVRKRTTPNIQSKFQNLMPCTHGLQGTESSSKKKTA